MSGVFDEEALRRAQQTGIRGVTSGDGGRYTCHECGHVWTAGERWVWWPIGIRWSLRPLLNFGGIRLSWFSTWGWQIGWDGIEQKVFGRSVRIGPIVITFGKQRQDREPTP